ncbi:MAG: hypothetical protein OEY41_14060, partial [Acidimicrobiia bacterium]|nr:hypothetical protein [Acidimicrobiia bacterium]
MEVKLTGASQWRSSNALLQAGRRGADGQHGLDVGLSLFEGGGVEAARVVAAFVGHPRRRRG